MCSHDEGWGLQLEHDCRERGDARSPPVEQGWRGKESKVVVWKMKKKFPCRGLFSSHGDFFPMWEAFIFLVMGGVLRFALPFSKIAACSSGEGWGWGGGGE